MYKSIVFDLGGVMIDFDPRGYLVDRLCNAETEEEVYDLTFGSEEWKLLDAGLISRFDGNHRMLEKARAAGRAFEVQGVLDDWLHILRPRHRMEELVRRLKSHGYCVYYLSNIPQDVLDLLRDRGVLDGFDGGVASCEVHHYDSHTIRATHSGILTCVMSTTAFAVTSPLTQRSPTMH